MDIKELKGDFDQVVNRHPWERARISSIFFILEHYLPICGNYTTLDIGCGDGFVLTKFAEKKYIQNCTGIDTFLQDQQIREFSHHHRNIAVFRDYSQISGRRFDLVLLLDVLEHIKDERDFLIGISDRLLKESGFIIITVPAFNWLYSSHDIFLKHYRRYSMPGLGMILNSTHLEIVASGYMFLSFLVIRCIAVFFEKIFCKSLSQSKGIGCWDRGPFVTGLLEFILLVENKVLFIINKIGLNIPGLSCWVLCKKQQ